MDAIKARPADRAHHLSLSGSEPDWTRHAAAWALGAIAAFSLLQLGFLTVGCDWDLCGDEAEYWTWSRRLDWSYFARGPLIALVIRLGTELAGPASLRLTGSLMPAVRLPSVVLSAVVAWGLYRLAGETCRSRRVGLVAVLLLPAIPLFRVGGLLMTCDTPLLACWVWAAVWSYRGASRGDTRSWLAAAGLVALGVTAKYTMLAFPASVGLYLLLDPSRRRELRRPGFWSLALGCLLGMAPVVYWNVRHGWVAADQMSDRLGFSSSWNWGSLGTLGAFLGGELVVLGFGWFLGLFGLVRAIGLASAATGRSSVRRTATATVRRDADPGASGLLYLVCLWVVVWTACVAVALLGETEANWGAPAYVALVVLMAWCVAPRVFVGNGAPRRAWPLVALWASGVIGLGLLQHTEWFYPLVAAHVPAPSATYPAPVRRLDPTCRMRGYRELADAVAARLGELRAAGEDPFVLAPTYTLAATLSFYLPGETEAYCLSWSPGLAATALNQHDLWHPNPRHDLDAFRHRTALVVEEPGRSAGYARTLRDLGVCGRADDPARLNVERGGLVVGSWELTVCRDYRGPQDVELIRKLLRKYTSNSYFAAQGSTPRAYVRGLYRDITGHPPSLADETFWTNVASRFPRPMVVIGIARGKSGERRPGTPASPPTLPTAARPA